MGCQKTIAGRILERHADYLLVLKANQGKAFLAIRACCEQHCFARGATGRPVFDAFDDSHGRLVRRRVFACPEAASLEALHAWPGLRTVLAVETIRGVNGSGTVEAEIRYGLSSCGDDPKVLIQAIRRHWTIDNGLPWMSPSVRMTAASGIGRQLATWLSCARSPSTSSVTAEQPRSACGCVASRLPGMMRTGCLYWLDDFMRRPCPMW
jgi:predicted transposase YbfD/YdcC